MNRAEGLGRNVRTALQLGDRPGADGLERLERWLAPAVSIDTWPCEQGFCAYWDDGTVSVWVPCGARRVWSTAHEVGHSLQTNGLGRRIERLRSRTWRVQRWKEEYLANRFARALLIPVAMATGPLTDWEIAEECGVSVEAVRERRKELAGKA